MANGFPMAAVITRPEIADVMKRAVTFNTFGGNPMACTAASATMDVGTQFYRMRIISAKSLSPLCVSYIYCKT